MNKKVAEKISKIELISEEHFGFDKKSLDL
jgi:hypothetical protein